jgi:hypothetical protein
MSQVTTTETKFVATVTEATGWKLFRAGKEVVAPTLAEYQEVLGRTVTEPSAPASTDYAQSNTKSAKIEGSFALPTLAEGQRITGVEYHVSITSSSGAKTKIANPVSVILGGAVIEPIEAGKQEWFKGGAGLDVEASEEYQYLTSSGTRVRFSLTLETSGKNVKAFEVYAVFTLVTEASVPLAGFGKSKSVPKGNLTLPGPSGETPVTYTLVLAVAVKAGSGATEVTDAAGNTWTLDAEVKEGSRTLQVWSAKLTKALAAAETVTVKGLPEAATSTVGVVTYPLAGSLKVDKIVSGWTKVETQPSLGLLRESKRDLGLAFAANFPSSGGEGDENVFANAAPWTVNQWIAGAKEKDCVGLSTASYKNPPEATSVLAAKLPKPSGEGSLYVSIAYRILVPAAATATLEPGVAGSTGTATEGLYPAAQLQPSAGVNETVTGSIVYPNPSLKPLVESSGSGATTAGSNVTFSGSFSGLTAGLSGVAVSPELLGSVGVESVNVTGVRPEPKLFVEGNSTTTFTSALRIIGTQYFTATVTTTGAASNRIKVSSYTKGSAVMTGANNFVATVEAGVAGGAAATASGVLRVVPAPKVATGLEMVSSAHAQAASRVLFVAGFSSSSTVSGAIIVYRVAQPVYAKVDAPGRLPLQLETPNNLFVSLTQF